MKPNIVAIEKPKIVAIDLVTCDILFSPLSGSEPRGVTNAYNKIVETAKSIVTNIESGHSYKLSQEKFSKLMSEVSNFKMKFPDSDLLTIAPGGNGLNKICNLGKLFESENIDLLGCFGKNNPNKKPNNPNKKTTNPNKKTTNLREKILTKIEQENITLHDGEQENIPSGLKTSVIIPFGNDKVCFKSSFELGTQFYDNLLPNNNKIKEADLLILESRSALSVSSKVLDGLLQNIGEDTIVTYTPPASLVKLKDAQKANQDKILQRANIVNLNIEELNSLLLYNDNKGDFKQLQNNSNHAINEIRLRFIQNNTENLFVVTDGANGCVVISRDFHMSIPAVSVDSKLIKNTTGAGDAFAAVFICEYFEYIKAGGQIDKKFVKKTANLASKAAVEVIKQPEAQLPKEKLLSVMTPQSNITGSAVEDKTESGFVFVEYPRC